MNSLMSFFFILQREVSHRHILVGVVRFPSSFHEHYILNLLREHFIIKDERVNPLLMIFDPLLG